MQISKDLMFSARAMQRHEQKILELEGELLELLSLVPDSQPEDRLALAGDAA